MCDVRALIAIALVGCVGPRPWPAIDVQQRDAGPVEQCASDDDCASGACVRYAWLPTGTCQTVDPPDSGLDAGATGRDGGTIGDAGSRLDAFRCGTEGSGCCPPDFCVSPFTCQAGVCGRF